MALYLVGLGLKGIASITAEGKQCIEAADALYLETYTSVMTNNSKEDLEQHFNKTIIAANRELVEQKAESTILKDAKEKHTVFLVVGDPLGATTHMDLYTRAKELNIEVHIINNTSILNAIGIVGLQLYKYGKVSSIPFHYENVTTPYDVYQKNKAAGLHTLLLLDLDPENNTFLKAKEATQYLIQQGLDPQTNIISCAQIGSDNPIINITLAKDVPDIQEVPQCLILPGDLHFHEEECLLQWG